MERIVRKNRFSRNLLTAWILGQVNYEGSKMVLVHHILFYTAGFLDGLQ